MLEKGVERHLSAVVLKAGGRCCKWTGTMGAPDRIVFLPRGIVLFVEVKTKGGKVSKIQEVMHRQLRSLGTEVHVIWSKEDADDLIKTALEAPPQ